MPSLEALLASDIEVAAVVTNPDRPAGRGMKLRESPVKRRALEAGLDVLQPPRARAPEVRERLAELRPDVATVVAYGSILPVALLAIPRLGFVNVHFSLLPAWRGAAPVQRAIVAGEEVSGVSIMVLTEGMDEGPVLARREERIGDDDTAGSLGTRLASAGAGLLVETLIAYESGRVAPAEQDHERATYAPKLTPEEARLDWNRPARAIRDQVRGLNPVPGAWTTFESKRLKVWEVRESPAAEAPAPGEIRLDGGIIAGAGDGALTLVDVQLEGRKRMTGEELARGLHVRSGHLE